MHINAKGGRKINWKNDEFTQTWGRFNRASAKDYEQQLKRVKSCGKNCDDTSAGQKDSPYYTSIHMIILIFFLHRCNLTFYKF